MARPMRQFVERHVVEVIRALEPGESWHRDEIAARHVESFTASLAYVRAGGSQEVIGKLVPRVRIANAHWLPGDDIIGKVLALVDIEDGIFSHHWHKAR